MALVPPTSSLSRLHLCTLSKRRVDQPWKTHRNHEFGGTLIGPQHIHLVVLQSHLRSSTVSTARRFANTFFSCPRRLTRPHAYNSVAQVLTLLLSSSSSSVELGVLDVRGFSCDNKSTLLYHLPLRSSRLLGSLYFPFSPGQSSHSLGHTKHDFLSCKRRERSFSARTNVRNPLCEGSKALEEGGVGPGVVHFLANRTWFDVAIRHA